MKQVITLLAVAIFATFSVANAQDAATKENVKVVEAKPYKAETSDIKLADEQKSTTYVKSEKSAKSSSYKGCSYAAKKSCKGKSKAACAKACASYKASGKKCPPGCTKKHASVSKTKTDEVAKPVN